MPRSTNARSAIASYLMLRGRAGVAPGNQVVWHYGALCGKTIGTE